MGWGGMVGAPVECVRRGVADRGMANSDRGEVSLFGRVGVGRWRWEG
jgi:hypothetical protein